MRILCISEHFHPRVGGTVEYVQQTCKALLELGHEIELLVPGDGDEDPEDLPYTVTRVPAAWPAAGDPDREARYRFCRDASDRALRMAEAGRIDIVHVLFGLFVNETLDTAGLQNRGVRVVTTIHNVPPQECGRSWPGDRRLPRIKDRLRLKLVAAKNRARLSRHDYDAWVVPSGMAAASLREVRPDARIEVIGHGCSGELLERVEVPSCRAPAAGEPVRLLTVGGWVPHKRQHLIPAVAARLREMGVAFVWELVGPPARVPHYHDSIRRDIAHRKLGEQVRVQGAVPFDDLVGYYSQAHLYVQPSTEEGFCMTALDAAAAGIPVVGCPAGALPEICRASEGVLVPSEVEDLARAVRHYVVAGLWPDDARGVAHEIRQQFRWRQAGDELSRLYLDVIGKEQTVKS
ncbi:glycosyltransferase family 4 protein [Luteolibacter marinus]|uniref:glycosyltransferase family 4 protein n=1 Tax=Luteolibacter marinus TaxID=2776705 RepID=UPI001866F43A|nr:glycosyltransferase family 4 protein [Luteolibacter marinus]